MDFEKNHQISVEQEGVTPLITAAHHGHYECVRWLLDAGADMTIQDRKVRHS